MSAPFEKVAGEFVARVYSTPSRGRGMARGLTQAQWTQAITKLMKVAYEAGVLAGAEGTVAEAQLRIQALTGRDGP